jgi:hypothetical protein
MNIRVICLQSKWVEGNTSGCITIIRDILYCLRPVEKIEGMVNKKKVNNCDLIICPQC